MGIIDNSVQLRTSNLNSNILYNIQPSSNTFTPLSLFNSSNTFYLNQINTKQNILTAATNLLGDGGNITNLTYTNINGKPATFPSDWTTTINKPSFFPVDTNTYYNKTETNNLLNNKEDTLTFSSPLNKTSSIVTINLNSYPTLTTLNPCYFITNSTSSLVNYPTFTVLNSCNYITNNTNGLVNYYNKTEINNISNFNSNFTILTSNSLFNLNTSTSNTIFINYSNLNRITSNTIYIDYTSLNTSTSNITFTNYLLKSGGTMTGDLIISKSNPILSIRAGGESQTSILHLSSPFNASSPNKTGIFSEGIGSWSRSRIHFCLNNLTDGSVVSLTDAKMTILPNGNVGIGITNPSGTLSINATTQLQARLILSGQEFYTPSFTSTNGIAFIVGVNRDNNRQLWITDSANLTPNTTNSVLRIVANGGVASIDAVATNGTTQLPLNINGSSLSIGTNTSISGTLSFGSRIENFLINLWGTNSYGFGINSSMLRYNSEGNHTFFCSGTERLRILNNGNIGIGINNPERLLHIRGGNPTYLRIDTSNSLANETTGIEFGIAGYQEASYAKITSTTSANYTNNLQFLTSSGENTSSAKMTILGSGNIGIGTANPIQKLHIDTGGLYITGNISNPGNTSSVSFWNQSGVGATISAFQFAVQTNGTTERLRILNNGNVGIGIASPNLNFELYGNNPSMCIRAADETQTSSLFLGTGFNTTGAYKAAIIAQGITGWSRSYLHFCLNNVADNTYPTQNAGLNNVRFTIRPDGNFNFYPDPFTINNQNNVNYSMNLNVATNTTATPALSTFLRTEVTDGFNDINTRVTLACSGSANSGYNNGSRIILDGSFGINGTGTTNSIIRFQSQATNGSWVQNAYLRTLDNAITFRCEGNISCFSLTQTSTSNIKTDIQPIINPLNIITQLNGHYYSNIKTNDYEYGLIAEDVDKICPCIVDKSIDDLIGIKYNSLIPILIESVKTLNYKIEELQEKISVLESRG